jgi:5-methylcytosine-specific restriction endonuclease McrA
MSRMTQNARRRQTRKRDAEDHRTCMEREYYVCQRCGARATQTHHRMSKSRRPDLRHDPQYHAALCYECHVYAHSHPRDFNEWFDNL